MIASERRSSNCHRAATLPPITFPNITLSIKLSLQVQLAQSSRECAELTAALEAAQHERARVAAELSKLSADRDDISALLAASTGEVAALNTKLAESAGESAMLSGKVAMLSAEIGELRSKLAGASNARLGKDARMAATSARSSDLFAKLASADSRVAELEARLAAVAQQLEAERSGHSKSVEQLQQHVRNVRERAQHVEKELKAKESQLQSALDVSRWAAQSVESLREELTAVLSRRMPDDPLASGDQEVREMTEKVIAMQQKMEKELSWHKTALENAQRYLDGGEKAAGEQSGMDALRKDLAEKVCQLNPIFTREAQMAEAQSQIHSLGE
ncbi:hypothetical protein KFL_017240010, partial [Klebsormidium nitens]